MAELPTLSICTVITKTCASIWVTVDLHLQQYVFYSEKALDTDRYFWVIAEGIAASALMGLETKDDQYWEWYGRLWSYANAFLIDAKHGGWFRILNEKNEKCDQFKSPPAKTDYHPICACWEILQVLKE